MVMLVSYPIDRLCRVAAAFVAVIALAAPAFDGLAQQPDQPKRQTPQKPPTKPRPNTAPKAATTSAAKTTEALPPSQIGIGTLAKQAYMVDPQSSTVLLFKDADKPMHPSSM